VASAYSDRAAPINTWDPRCHNYAGVTWPVAAPKPLRFSHGPDDSATAPSRALQPARPWGRACQPVSGQGGFELPRNSQAPRHFL